MTPEAVLFDLDGVLIDSRTAIVRCLEHGLREVGAAVPPAARLGLAEHVRAVVGPDLDATDEVKSVTVARALTALGLGPGAAAPLVGDRRHDAEAAHANGIPCVGVLWGIGDEAELRAAGCTTIVAEPADLPAALGFIQS
jgi:phosphoglycolate phosphatase